MPHCPICLPPFSIPSEILPAFSLFSYLPRSMPNLPAYLPASFLQPVWNPACLHFYSSICLIACPICLPTWLSTWLPTCLPPFCIPPKILPAFSFIHLSASEHAPTACPSSLSPLPHSICNPACFPANSTICHSMPQLHALLPVHILRHINLKFRSVTICPSCLYPCLSPPPPPTHILTCPLACPWSHSNNLTIVSTEQAPSVGAVLWHEISLKHTPPPPPPTQQPCTFIFP
jgi:hypothetical protein